MPCFLPLDGEAPESAAGWLAAGPKIIHPVRVATGLPDAVRDASPRFFSSAVLPYSFDPAAACPRWLEALEQWQPDPEPRRHLQMMAGLAISGDLSHNVYFTLSGPQGTGKSQFIAVLEALMGAANVCPFSLHSLADASTLGSFASASLAVCHDSDGEKDQSDLSKAEGVIKKATGGEFLQVREMYKNGGSALCRALIVMLANDLPPFRDRTGALMTRQRVIPFTRVFRGTGSEKRDLAKEIIAAGELPGILNWALAGAAMARQCRRFPELFSGAAIKGRERTEADSCRAFIAEELEEDSADLIGLEALGGLPSLELYKLYKSWCHDRGRHPLHEGNFCKAIEHQFPAAIKRRERRQCARVYVWRGVRRVSDLIQPEDPPFFAASAPASVEVPTAAGAALSSVQSTCLPRPSARSSPPVRSAESEAFDPSDGMILGPDGWGKTPD